MTNKDSSKSSLDSIQNNFFKKCDDNEKTHNDAQNKPTKQHKKNKQDAKKPKSGENKNHANNTNNTHNTNHSNNNTSHSNQTNHANSGFANFNLKKFVLDGIIDAGFTNPSPVQEQSIPIVLKGKDLIAQAQTGTGKTAAFAIPILNLLQKNKDIEALIITPTRELAVQISEEILKLGRFGRIKTICMYGGQSIKRQCDLLEKNPKVMIATPGRLLDHLKNERLKNFSPKIVVLDESDEMLDMGFLDDIEEIFKYLPSNHQTLLFSATMPEAIKKLALRILDNPEFVKITPTDITNKDIEQQYYIINESERDEAIVRLIEMQNPSKSIIFVRMKKEADALSNRLSSKGFKSMALHGDLEQWERREAMKSFKDNSIEILVATDVASRGIDISGVSHVFNYHIPLNPESYVHRIGRTGRAGKKGVAITLATPLEYKELSKIKQITKAKLELCEITQEISNDKLSQEIAMMKVDDKSINIYEQLRDKIDLTQLCLKLISLHLERSKNAKIGLSKKEIEKLEKDIESKPKNTRTRHSRPNKKYEKPNKSKRNNQNFVDKSTPYTDSIWG